MSFEERSKRIVGEFVAHCQEDAPRFELSMPDRARLVESITTAQQAASNAAVTECRAKHGPPTIKVKRLQTDPEVPLPARAHSGDAAYDLVCCVDCIVPAAETLKVSIGLAFEMPEGWFAKIETRSGMAAKGIFATGGVIDTNYRGPVHVVLNNSTSEDYPVHAGDRIAQMLILPVFSGAIEEVAELTPTGRGDKGFGSTGR